ncbi:MAG TPA: hypothetical protein VHJ17_18545, partial [Thermomonospora sp.]|nr:hypothetical protein [Thermomonospora sp.]
LNARDGAARAVFRCARVGGASLGPCPLVDTQLTRCVGPPPRDGNFVEIRTLTLTPDGRTLFPPVFGAAVLGDSHQGGQAAACARATWGPLAAHPEVFAFGVAQCALGRLAADPGFTPVEQVKAATPDPAFEAEVREGDCADPAGALAWLGPPGGDCFQELTAGREIPGVQVTPSTAPATCGGTSFARFVQDNRAPLPVAVYDAVTPGAGGRHTYRVSGFAYLLPTGFRLGAGVAQTSWRTGAACGGPEDDPCLTGFLTRGTVHGAVGTGPDYGLTAVRLIG